MIGKLKGTLDEIDEDHCLVDVHGVGYVAYCSARTLAALPSPGEAVVLFIETYVREDMLRLYGFQSQLEREWFRLLMSNVPGRRRQGGAGHPVDAGAGRPRQCDRAARHRHGFAARPASARRWPSASSPN